MLPYIVRHVECLVDLIAVYDDASSDASRELIERHPPCGLRHIPSSEYNEYPLLWAKGQSWKVAMSDAGWVIECDVDGFPFHVSLQGTLSPNYPGPASSRMTRNVDPDARQPRAPSSRRIIHESPHRIRPGQALVDFNRRSARRRRPRVTDTRHFLGRCGRDVPSGEVRTRPAVGRGAANPPAIGSR